MVRLLVSGVRVSSPQHLPSYVSVRCCQIVESIPWFYVDMASVGFRIKEVPFG
jgi:hypothetical protein